MKSCATSLIVSIALLFASVAAASTPVPRPPSIASDSHILMDAHTGRILTESNADDRLGPASLTKIMTAYAVYSALESGQVSFDDEVVVSEDAWRMGGSRMFLEVGTTVNVDDLLDGMVIQSGNDASLSLAEHVAGSEDAFTDLMNTYAGRIGMENTQFMNSHGMPHPEQYTSARDMARLAQALIESFPDHYKRYSQREFTYNGITQYNRNQLLWSDETVDGVKTGYTSESGYALVSSAERNGMRLISVIMGSPSVQRRTNDSRAMLNWGFRFFETHRLFEVGETVENGRVWEGVRDEVALGPERDVLVTVPRGEYENLTATLSFPEAIVAPVSAGDTLGRVVVTHDEEELDDVAVVALEDVERAGFFGRMADRVRQWFED